VTYQRALNALRFVDYLKQLMKHRKTPLSLILDSLPAHKGPLVRSYVDSLRGKLQLHYLPGYAPELNPDELVWNHMTRTGTAKKPFAQR
jgi:transposase